MEIDQDVFNRNLLLTQVYCEMQLQKPVENNASVLRSFNPEYDGKPLFTFGIGDYNNYSWNKTNWHIDPLHGDGVFYNELFDMKLQNKIEIFEQSTILTQYRGKILATDIDETFLDGASEAASDGFIDIYDCPPINTWFYITRGAHGRILLAWVPQQFEELVQEAIDVNTVDCLSWYGEPKLVNRVQITKPLARSTQLESKSIWKYIISLFKG